MSGLFDEYAAFVVRNQVWLLTLIFALCLAGTIFFVRASLRLENLRRLYRSALASDDPADLDEYLAAQHERQQVLGERIAVLEHELGGLREQAASHLQRWALDRYKAFKDVGGDQSFTLALLDGRNNGFILTVIHGRDESRVYGKSVAAGEAVHPLSEEERKVLRAAMEEIAVRKKENPIPTAK